MDRNPEVTPHEADSSGRFTPDNAKEMGSRGAAKREENIRECVTETRQELATHALEAAQTLAGILASDARDADKVRASTAILDRSGVGPHSSHDVSDSASLVEQWAAESMRRKAPSRRASVRNHAKPRPHLLPLRTVELESTTCDPDSKDYPPGKGLELRLLPQMPRILRTVLPRRVNQQAALAIGRTGSLRPVRPVTRSNALVPGHRVSLDVVREAGFAPTPPHAVAPRVPAELGDGA